MKTIPLTQGKVACVDDDDFPILSCFNWYASKVEYNGLFNWYAMRKGPRDKKSGKQQTILMHIYVMKPPLGSEVDHHNGNGLDNRRSNLRICSHAKNMRNRRKSLNGTSKFKGVSWRTRNQKWQVTIKKNEKSYFVAYCDDEESAALYYNVAAQLIFGAYAYLNSI